MRKDFGVKQWLMPEPVLIIGTFDKDGNPNAMNAAWGGMYDYDKVVIALSKHKTTENLKVSEAFSLAFATKDTVEAADYVGIVSQNREPDKIKKAGLTFTKSEKVHAPIFDQFPITMECEVHSFDENEGVLIGKIVNVGVDDKFIINDKIDVESIGFIAFDPISGKYRLVREEVADAFKVGLKRK